MEALYTVNPWTNLDVKRSKVKVTRPINAHRVNAQYLQTWSTNFKLGTQTEDEDPRHRQAPWPPRSKVKVARSHDVSDRYWPIRQERNLLETPKLVWRLRALLAIMRTSFKAKGQRSRSQGRLILRPKVYVISSNWEGLRTSNSVHGLWSWVIARRRENIVSTAPGGPGHRTCYVSIMCHFTGMAVFLRNISFHGILLDALFEPGNPDWQSVHDLVSNGIRDGTVKPLMTTVFERDDIEAAFRFMAHGKHIGKVLIKVYNCTVL